MAQYLLLLYDNPKTWQEMKPADLQKAFGKYMAWGQQLRDKKIWLGSHKLADEPGKVIRGKDGQPRVSDGPYSETKEVLGGYYLIEAPGYEAAVAESRTCPHLEYGGTIEVRQVDEMVPSK